jgi:hypothetical protein
MDNVRDSRGWRVETSEFIKSADLAHPHFGQTVEVDAQFDGIDVSIETGCGYMNTRADCRIPIDVLIRLLESVGYKITVQVSNET